jgi:hypothetical protein
MTHGVSVDYKTTPKAEEEYLHYHTRQKTNCRFTRYHEFLE